MAKRYEVLMETEDHMSGGDVTVEAEDVAGAITAAQAIWPNRIVTKVYEVAMTEIPLPE